MEHKRIGLPGAKPGWLLEGHLRAVNGIWKRFRVDAEGPVHTNTQGEQKRWHEIFDGYDCEENARRYMQEHYGQDPFIGKPDTGY